MHNFKESEEEILKFWKDKKIYEKSRKKNEKGKKFYFMDGPPYATGHIHMGTALNKILKDIVMRSRRLQGYDVFDRPGYDTHGVPIEFQIEKEIGSKSKKDIEKYGIKKFIDKCKEFATKYIDVMNSEFKNLGVWMDWSNPYLTLNDEYIEAIWQAFKKAEEKNLLYLGKYPVHVCPRCETAVAFNEIEYAKQEDTAVFVKFPVKGRKNSFFIIWTTTPWTLPGNTGIMVHPDYTYQEIEVVEGERWILAKDLVPELMRILERSYKVIHELKGAELAGMNYENPLAKNLKLKLKNAYKVVTSARYVNLEEGSGLVHCAPGHGKEDYEVGKENSLDTPCPVDINGVLTEEAGKYQGKKARVVDSEIIEDLKKDHRLVYSHKYSHDYPFCWRCKSALLMVSQPQWFLKISGIQKKVLKENEKTNWVPDWMQLRMKAWLEGIGDWPVSRKRYWGTPLPIWVCNNCQHRIVIGSLDELKKISKQKKIDVHKPGIDEVKLKCKCGEEMRRVEEVLDVWFDSGVSSWAALGYPSSSEKFKKYWPAEINIEGKDQIRGWWNSQIILSEITFDKKPFGSIVVHGMVLDLGKKKMSKSLGNIVAPKDIIAKYGRDLMRYYFAKISKGEDFAFDENEFKEIQKVINFLVNINNFISQIEKGKQKINIEDKWVLSRLNSTIKDVALAFETYKLPEAVQKIEKFLVDDISKTYIKIIRDRADETYGILNEIRVSLLKLLAPICPLLAENLWQQLRKEKIVDGESIHLSSWPKCDEKKIDKKLEEEFSSVLEIIETGLSVRDKSQIGLKWPLAMAEIKTDKHFSKEIQEIIARQLNVKSIKIEKSKEKELAVKLDTKLTPELEAEGFAREISRKVQALRKDAGLVKTDKIELVISVSKEMEKMIDKQKEMIKERTNSEKIEIIFGKPSKKFKTESKEKIKEKEMLLFFNKI